MHVGHIRCILYTCEGKAKTINIPFLEQYGSHLEFSHFTQVIYYTTLQIYFGHHLKCICDELLFHATIIFRRFSACGLF